MRRGGALVMLVQIAVVLAVGIPVVAITQPFLPPHQGAFVLAMLTLLLLVALWRNASNLQGHARAGAQIIAFGVGRPDGVDRRSIRRAEAARGCQRGLARAWRAGRDSGRRRRALRSGGVWRSSIFAALPARRCWRSGEETQQIPTPLGREVIQAGDVLAVAGAHDALAIARAIFAPDLARIRDDAEGAEIQAELEALNDALLTQPPRRSTGILP